MWRIIPNTSWVWRPEVNTTYSTRLIPWNNCMSIIETWFWDDTKLWEDDKIWWDNWSIWTSWNERTIIITNWS